MSLRNWSAYVVAVACALAGELDAGADADSDFQARCTAPGVTRCVPFDNTTTDIVRNVNLFPGDGGYWGGSLDTSVRSSGAGSLRFTLPAGRGTSDISGMWNDTLGGAFGEGSTWYAQFRQQISPEMISNLQYWRAHVDTAWKTADFHGVDGNGSPSTCGQIELTTVAYPFSSTPALEMYTGCGDHGFTTDSNGTVLIQQGASSTSGFNCDFNDLVAGTGNGQGCFVPPISKWVTFYYKFHIGTYGAPNSSVEAWIAIDGGPYLQWVNQKNTTLLDDGPGLDKYKELMLSPYMTGLQDNGAAPVSAFIWFDELIISTQPIAAPGAGGVAHVPSPPTNLVVE